MGHDPLAELQTENARLIALLERRGIDWRAPPVLTQPDPVMETSRLSTEEKVALFRQLFQGRKDVYPVRWESRTTGKTGYAPACANEWRAGVCEKPRIKCSDCVNAWPSGRVGDWCPALASNQICVAISRDCRNRALVHPTTGEAGISLSSIPLTKLLEFSVPNARAISMDSSITTAAGVPSLVIS